MPYLIKGANVFTPKFLGKKDVLILEEKIAAIEDDLSQASLPKEEREALKPDVQNFKYQNSFSAELLLLSVF